MNNQLSCPNTSSCQLCILLSFLSKFVSKIVSSSVDMIKDQKDKMSDWSKETLTLINSNPILKSLFI